MIMICYVNLSMALYYKATAKKKDLENRRRSNNTCDEVCLGCGDVRNNTGCGW
jgi:hypothetical protein